MRNITQNVTTVRKLVWRAMVLFVRFGGSTKFALSPGGGGNAPTVAITPCTADDCQDPESKYRPKKGDEIQKMGK